MLQRLFAIALLSLGSVASAQSLYQAGRDYEVIEPPVATTAGNRIEVQEVFGYWCIHCAHAEPAIRAWKDTLPGDVAFSFTPSYAAPGGAEEIFARAFYAADALGLLDRTHAALLQATAIDRRIQRPEDIVGFFVEQGADRAEFEATMQSFAVDAKLKKLEQTMPRYRLGGTPTMLVNGKYRVMAPAEGGFAKMLQIVDFLIEQERAGRS